MKCIKVCTTVKYLRNDDNGFTEHSVIFVGRLSAKKAREKLVEKYGGTSNVFLEATYSKKVIEISDDVVNQSAVFTDHINEQNNESEE